MRIEAIIFDLGGTLLEYAADYDSWPELEEPGFIAAHEHLLACGISLPDRKDFQALGFNLLPDRWRQATRGQRNLTVPSLLRELLDHLGVSQLSDEILENAAVKYQEAVCAGVRMMPNSLQTVRTLKESGFRLALVSNTMFKGEIHIADLQKFGLARYFDAMVFSADVNKWKPDPAPFLEVLERIGVNPPQAVFVGDDPTVDIIGGQRAGLYTIHYPSSQRFSSPDGYDPDDTIESLSQLPQLLARLNGQSGHDKLDP